MSDCLSEKVRRSKRIKNLPGKMIVSKNEWDSYYNHFTICVKSLSEYIDVVSKLFKIVEKPYDERLAFRGHSDASSNYKLQPSIARKQFAVGYSETGNGGSGVGADARQTQEVGIGGGEGVVANGTCRFVQVTGAAVVTQSLP